MQCKCGGLIRLHEVKDGSVWTCNDCGRREFMGMVTPLLVTVTENENESRESTAARK